MIVAYISILLNLKIPLTLEHAWNLIVCVFIIHSVNSFKNWLIQVGSATAKICLELFPLAECRCKLYQLFVYGAIVQKAISHLQSYCCFEYVIAWVTWIQIAKVAKLKIQISNFTVRVAYLKKNVLNYLNKHRHTNTKTPFISMRKKLN